MRAWAFGAVGTFIGSPLPGMVGVPRGPDGTLLGAWVGDISLTCGPAEDALANAKGAVGGATRGPVGALGGSSRFISTGLVPTEPTDRALITGSCSTPGVTGACEIGRTSLALASSNVGIGRSLEAEVGLSENRSAFGAVGGLNMDKARGAVGGAFWSCGGGDGGGTVGKVCVDGGRAFGVATGVLGLTVLGEGKTKLPNSGTATDEWVSSLLTSFTSAIDARLESAGLRRGLAWRGRVADCGSMGRVSEGCLSSDLGGPREYPSSRESRAPGRYLQSSSFLSRYSRRS
jgi:hypothetical protein